MLHVKNKIKVVARKLVAALDEVEQAAQAVRWRVANAPEDLLVLGGEVSSLCGQSAQIATAFGEFAALMSLESAGESRRCSACRTDLAHRCEECSGSFCTDCVQEQARRSVCVGFHHETEVGDGSGNVTSAAFGLTTFYLMEVSR